MKSILATMLAGAALLQSGLALAQPAMTPPGAEPQGMGPAAMAPPDEAAGAGGRRGMGRNAPLTLEAFQARARDRILRADADHDGRVSLAEWTAAHPPRDPGEGGRWGGDPVRQFQMLDANHDGFVTPAEIDAASAVRFARMDSNHDGVVTPDERRAMSHGGGQGGPEPQ